MRVDTCECGSNSAGVCRDCRRAICAWESQVYDDSFFCNKCAEMRQSSYKTSLNTYYTTIMAGITEIADPVEGLVRLAWHLQIISEVLALRTRLDNGDIANLLVEAFPKYKTQCALILDQNSRGPWDSSVVSSWFAETAITMGIAAEHKFNLYKRNRRKHRAPVFVDALPCWKFQSDVRGDSEGWGGRENLAACVLESGL
jgi:hypothetical protein